MDKYRGRREQGVSRVSRAVPRGFSPEAFKKLRVAMKVEVSDLARVAGVGTATISQWERGSRDPQIDKLAAVITTLATSPGHADELMETVIIVPRASRMIADWRALRGILQPRLADMIKKDLKDAGSKTSISTMGLSNVERGITPLRPEIAVALARALRLTVEDVEHAWDVARNRPLR